MPLPLLAALKTTPFSDVTTGCATIIGHVGISPLLLFLHISVLLLLLLLLLLFLIMSIRFDFLWSFSIISRKVNRTAEVPLNTQFALALVTPFGAREIRVDSEGRIRVQLKQ